MFSYLAYFGFTKEVGQHNVLAEDGGIAGEVGVERGIGIVDQAPNGYAASEQDRLSVR